MSCCSENSCQNSQNSQNVQSSYSLPPYPLFDEIINIIHNNKNSNIVDLSLTSNTLRNMANTLSISDSLPHYQEIMALIIHFYAVGNKGKIPDTVPFSGNCMPGGKGILYNVSEIPPLLQEIIQTYIIMNC